jgi:hypothetical protein
LQKTAVLLLRARRGRVWHCSARIPNA